MKSIKGIITGIHVQFASKTINHPEHPIRVQVRIWEDNDIAKTYINEIELPANPGMVINEVLAQCDDKTGSYAFVLDDN
jgi:hypothetical protein